VEYLQEACEFMRPAVVFINEDCFIHHPESNELIRHIICQIPGRYLLSLCR
jgi:LuxR family capsular biosynthesis transcriptional activator